MSSVVKNNLPAQFTLGELNKNVNRVGVLLGKVASGQKINSAKDDAGQFAISEKMREQIRTMLQDNQNVQNGSSMLKVAEGGVNNIVEELRNLKELAINSANDTNTNVDRLTIQKEFNQKMSNINDIATMTNYNGISLLDGTFDAHDEIVTKYKWISESAGAKKMTKAGPDPNKIVFSGAVEPTKFIQTIQSGNFTIDTDGVYELAAGYSGTLTINAQNVKIVQADPSTALNDVYMTESSGNANLWIENLNVKNNQDKNFIKFQGSGNTLNFEGTNNINVGNGSNAVINVGGGLTVEGGQDGSGVFNFSNSTGFRGASIGSNANENLGSSDVVINSGNFYASSYREGAFIGAGSYAYIGDITINGGSFVDNYKADNYPHDALIGGGDSAHVGNITIDNADITTTYMYSDPAIGVGGSGSGTVGDITITNSSIYYRGLDATAIGTGKWSTNTTVGNITIENCLLDIVITGGGAGIGTGNYGNVNGDIKIKNTDLSNVSATGGGEQVGKGVNGKVTGRVIIENEPGGGSDEVTDNNGYWETSEHIITTRKNPLTIHHGAKANQATNFYINDMHTKSLGTETLFDDAGIFYNEDDAERYRTLSYDKRKQEAWLETLKAAGNKNLDQIDVKTRFNANVAIRVLDGAIEYALNESTHLGSYLQRLDYTNANVTTMSENIQASESKIRDADMAKEMTDYTKANVLSQSAQSMLAQANQNISQVLSLLQ